MSWRKNLYFCFVFLFGLIVNQLQAQSSNIGTPPIKNYSKKIYNAGTQSWDIAQSKSGIMYFANNGGLLEFDGVNWKCHGVTNQTNVRSLRIAEDGKIFVGAQGELGYFFPDGNGTLRYVSLKYLLPEELQNIADVWDIEILGDRIFFRTKTHVFIYENEKFKVLHTSEDLLFSKVLGSDYFVQDNEKGLLKLSGDSLQPVGENTILAGKTISGIYTYHLDTLLVFTIKEGIYLYANNELNPWQSNDKNLLKNSRIYTTTQIKDDLFAIGTSMNGVFVMNKKGEIVRHIHQGLGLQNNNVLSVFCDYSNNLWVGLNNGIDYIETSSPFTYISSGNGVEGTGYAVQILNDQIYLGTSNGVYQRPWKSYYNPTDNQSFDFLSNTNGQVWDLLQFENELLINHHEGTFVVRNGVATKVSKTDGSWMQIPLDGEDGLFLSGYYDGLAILDKRKGWQEIQSFEADWKESCRFIAQDEDRNIWVSHPYRGVFRVKFNEDYTKLEDTYLYNSNHGFPSDLQIYVSRIGDEAIFCGDRGVYYYDAESNRFQPNMKWNEVFGVYTWVKRLIDAPNGDIWFVADEEVGVLDVKDGGVYKEVFKKTFPQLSQKLVGGFEKIYPYDSENVFFASENGFIHFNPQQELSDTSFNVLIRKVEQEKDGLVIFGGNEIDGRTKAVIDFQNNSLRFSFASTYFGDIEKNQFQYRLGGFEGEWSEWTTNTEKEYTNLDAGHYTFYVRAKNIYGNWSEVTTFDFRVKPPWYASMVAMVIYFLILCGIIFSLIFIPRKQFEKEKAALQVEQEQTLQLVEQEHEIKEQKQKKQISQLEKDKLELQIQSQNKELASTTMHLVQKSEMLQKLKEELQKIAKSSSDDTTSKQLRKIIRKVNADQQLDNDWDQFSKHFDQVHSDFLKRLRETYPQLTPKDHRLCAYLRMNLTTKEIAPLMNISVRGVEIARYRLRKKLAIDGDVNLVELMLEV